MSPFTVGCSEIYRGVTIWLPFSACTRQADTSFVMTTPHTPASPWQQHLPSFRCPPRQLIGISLLDVVRACVGTEFALALALWNTLLQQPV